MIAAIPGGKDDRLEPDDFYLCRIPPFFWIVLIDDVRQSVNFFLSVYRLSADASVFITSSPFLYRHSDFLLLHGSCVYSQLDFLPEDLLLNMELPDLFGRCLTDGIFPAIRTAQWDNRVPEGVAAGFTCTDFHNGLLS